MCVFTYINQLLNQSYLTTLSNSVNVIQKYKQMHTIPAHCVISSRLLACTILESSREQRGNIELSPVKSRPHTQWKSYE